MMQLVRQTCLWGQGQYNGWVIPRAIYRRYEIRDHFSINTQLLTSRKRYVTARTTSYDVSGAEIQRLDVTLLKPYQTSESVHQETETGTGTHMVNMEPAQARSALVFTEEGLQQYLTESSDTNPLHQGTPALVPGLWILDCLRKRFVPDRIPVELDIRFVRPVYTGPPVLLYQKQSRVTGVCGSLACFYMNIKPIATGGNHEY